MSKSIQIDGVTYTAGPIQVTLPAAPNAPAAVVDAANARLEAITREIEDETEFCASMSDKLRKANNLLNQRMRAAIEIREWLDSQLTKDKA